MSASSRRGHRSSHAPPAVGAEQILHRGVRDHQQVAEGTPGEIARDRPVDRAVQRPVRCRQALDVYLHRLRGGIGAMAAALGGADALVFTGGVGEHAWQIREQALEGLDFLGVAIDRRRNATADGDCELTAEGAPARTVVVRAREDLEMARQVRARLLTPAADPVPSHEHQATLR